MLKSYFCYETIICHKTALKSIVISLMKKIEKKKNFVIAISQAQNFTLEVPLHEKNE